MRVGWKPHDVTQINFRFWFNLCSCDHLYMVEMHLSTKFGGNTFIQSGHIDIFRNSVWRPEWKRQRGRPCRTWVQQIEDDTGLNANDAWRIAYDRKSWRALRPVAGQAFHWLTDWLSRIFMMSEFGTFRHDVRLFLKLCAKFNSNISYNRWERPTFCSRRSTDYVMRINFRFRFPSWASPRGRVASLC